MSNLPDRLRQAGLTLIELLVSMVVGLIVILAAMAAYLGSASAARVTEAQTQMNEDAQAALAILAQQLRMAGNNPVQPGRVPEHKRNPVYEASTAITDFPTVLYAVRGCDGTFESMELSSMIDVLVCPDGLTGPDSIAVTYEADKYNTPKLGGNNASDCTAEAPPVQTAQVSKVAADGTITHNQDVTYQVVENRYYVGTSTAITTPSLYCMNRSDRREPLVENVVDLQFLYGVVPPGAEPVEGNIAGYLTAQQITTHGPLSALPDAERWRRVAAVRVCVVMRSQNPVADSLASARWVRCDGSVETNPTDLHLRRAYHTTVALRNRM